MIDIKGTEFTRTIEGLIEVFTLPEVEFLPSKALKLAIQNGTVTTAKKTVTLDDKDESGITRKQYRQTYTSWALTK